jgi:hypothetical protein
MFQGNVKGFFEFWDKTLRGVLLKYSKKMIVPLAVELKLLKLWNGPSRKDKYRVSWVYGPKIITLFTLLDQETFKHV